MTASTRPRARARGIRGLPATPRQPREGFNEAASARSRNCPHLYRHRPSRMSSTRPRARARGILEGYVQGCGPDRLTRPRARARGIVKVRRYRFTLPECFNEAASARSRNFHKSHRNAGHCIASTRPRARARGISRVRVHARYDHPASTRPRARARGITNFSGHTRLPANCFNEAASARSRNSNDEGQYCRWDLWLQRGRERALAEFHDGLHAMCVRELLQRGRERALAELSGPSGAGYPGGGFNEAASARSRNWAATTLNDGNEMLQRGRERALAEFRPGRAGRAGASRLQRGRERALAELRSRIPPNCRRTASTRPRARARGIAAGCVSRVTPGPASTRPRARARGINLSQHHWQSHVGFNEAASARSRNYSSQDAVVPICLLQRGRERALAEFNSWCDGRACLATLQRGRERALAELPA